MAIRKNASLKALALHAVMRANQLRRIYMKSMREHQEAKDRSDSARDNAGRGPWQYGNAWVEDSCRARKLWSEHAEMAWHLARHLDVTGPRSLFGEPETLWTPDNN